MIELKKYWKIIIPIILISLVYFDPMGVKIWLTPKVEQFIPNSLIISQKYQVKQVSVLADELYDITLDNDKRYLVKLPVRTPASSKSKIVEFFNKLNNSGKSIYFVPINWNEKEGLWVGDFIWNEHGDTLTDWLKINGLIFER